MAEPLETLSELSAEQLGPEGALAREQATALAISRLVKIELRMARYGQAAEMAVWATMVCVVT